MSYMHIPNLYSDGTILQFKRCFALEKVHGTSSHVAWRDGKLHFSPGGCKLETFVAIFNETELTEKFKTLGYDEVVVFGEQYGGKQQGMSATYGKEAQFIAFEVKIGATWLNVPNAADVASKLGLEFVPFKEIPCDLVAIDAERDADSEVALRRGMGPGKKREGAVLRPLNEFRDNRGNRIIAKHKRDDFRETKTPRVVGEPTQPSAGEAAALEWVTDRRMEHVLDHLRAELGREPSQQDIPGVMAAMIEDVEREANGEVPLGDKATRKAISAKTVKLFQTYLRAKL